MDSAYCSFDMLFLTKPVYIYIYIYIYIGYMGLCASKHVCLGREKAYWINYFLSQKRFGIRLEKHKMTHVYENHHYITIKCPPVQFNEE